MSHHNPSTHGFNAPNDNRQIEHLGSGFLHCGQHVSTGFCLLSHEFAMPSCRLSFDSGRDALQ